MPLLDWVNRNQAEETATQVPYHLLKFEKSYGDEKQAKIILLFKGIIYRLSKHFCPFIADK